MADKALTIVVVGAGAAGLSAALRAVDAGAAVTLISRDIPQRSGSACVREGLAAVLSGAEGDSVSRHAEDTQRCGEFMANRGAVLGMCEAAPAIASMLARIGLVFDRTFEGFPRAVRSAGSSFARALTSGRSFGQRMVSLLAGQAIRAEAQGRLSANYGWEFLSLVQDDSGRACGAVAQDLRNMQIKAFPADAVIICTGGFPALFGRHCSSQADDGAAMVACWEQGATIANPEFVQATPFALSCGGGFVSVPDSVFASGAELWIERDGRPWHFLREAHRDSEGSVPSDVALRTLISCSREAGASRISAKLDIRNLDPDLVSREMPCLIEVCDAAGIDPVSEPIEVGPAVKNTLGGLWVNADHACSVEGLYAAGDAACLYHGACALGGNELLASLHGGMKAAAGAVKAASGRDRAEVPASLLAQAVLRESDLVGRISSREGRENAYAIGAELSDTLFEGALIEKENEKLARATGRLGEFAERLAAAPLMDRSEWANAELSFHRRLARRLKIAELYLAASVAREESRGSHHKPALPARDDKRWFAITKAVNKSGKHSLDHSLRVEGEPGERAY